MIKGIQGETEAAVKIMTQGNTEVNAGIELSYHAGAVLNEIVKSSQYLLDMINQIAATNEEQSATSEQIARNVSSISKVVGETTKRIEEIVRLSDDLNSITEQLRILMDQFTVERIDNKISQIRHLEGKKRLMLKM